MIREVRGRPEQGRAAALKSAAEPPSSRGLYVLFFFSGASALVYEISWSRQIGLLFGQSEHTAAVVLGSYFAGMAIGYLLASRWSTKVAPLVGYGAAELVVAAWATLIPTLLDAIERHAPAAILDHPSLAAKTAARTAIGFFSLLPATVALGATLPFMAQAVATDRRRGSGRVALAYGLNTLGALVGVVSATAVLLLFVGVKRSGYFAAAISTLCGLSSWALSAARGKATHDEIEPEVEPGLAGFWVGIAAISGFGTLALEVLYTRMFALVFHNSTYTFGVVVALFLLGLAIGSSALARVRMDPSRLAGIACLLGAAAVAGSLPLFASLTEFEYFRTGKSFATYLASAALIVSACILPPMVALGMILPATWSAAEEAGAGRGRAVGRLTAANTIAAAIGSFAASFLLAPLLGLWMSFGAVAGLFALAGCALLWRAGATTTGPVLAALAIAGIVFGVVAPSRLMTEPGGTEILFRKDGPYGLVEVASDRRAGKLTIRQNRHYGLGSSQAAGRELAQGHLPLLLHDRPRDILFLGVGTGVTAAAVLSHPEVDRAVVVELNPDVVDVSRRYFRDVNRGVLDDPRVTVVIDDARHYLARTDRKFDVIVSDLFVPWESHTGYLYTVEHFREARRKLKPGGLFCQWLALYQVGEREFESIADSVASVFPVTTLWWGDVDLNLSFVALIGSEQPITIDESRLADRLRALRQRPEEAGEYLLESPDKMMIHFNGRWTVRGRSRLNTDEHPYVEFLAPITQRDDRLLRRSILVEYESRVLRKLRKAGVMTRRSAPSP